MVAGALAYPAKLERAAIIGLGGGRTAWYLHKSVPELSFTAAELDPEVAQIADRFFSVRPEHNFDVEIKDGRVWLSHSDEKFDVILIDAYRGPFVPFHLLTKEFYALVKSRLNPGGVVVQNIEPSTMLFDSATATLNSVFPAVDFYDGVENVVAVGYDGPPLKQADLLARAAKAQQRYNLRYNLRSMVAERRVLKRPIGKVMTDDFAPVETLRAIEKNNRKWMEQTEAPR